jgi:hypothetical protein
MVLVQRWLPCAVVAGFRLSVRRTVVPVLLGLLSASAACAQDSTALVRVPIPERGADARARVMRAMTHAGLPVGAVAPCDCLVTSAPTEIATGLLSTRTVATVDAIILPLGAGSEVLLAVRVTSAPVFSAQPVQLVPSDTTKRMPDEARRAARLLHAVAARVREASAPP